MHIIQYKCEPRRNPDSCEEEAILSITIFNILPKYVDLFHKQVTHKIVDFRSVKNL